MTQKTTEKLNITIEEHTGMNGVVILTCNGKMFQFKEKNITCAGWFKIPSTKGPTFIDCDTLIQALKIVKGIMRIRGA